MFTKTYPWALMAAATNEIDLTKARFYAALTCRGGFRGQHKTVADFQKIGKIVAVSPLVLLPDGSPTGEEMEFLDVPGGSLIENVIVYQGSDHTGIIDLPAREQRLVAFMGNIPCLPATTRPEGQRVAIQWRGDIAALLIPGDETNEPVQSALPARTTKRWKVRR